jgi:hypothetical protein
MRRDTEIQRYQKYDASYVHCRSDFRTLVVVDAPDAPCDVGSKASSSCSTEPEPSKLRSCLGRKWHRTERHRETWVPFRDS